MPKASSKQKQRPSEPIARNPSLKRYPRSLNPVKEQDIGQDSTYQKKDLLSSSILDYAYAVTDDDRNKRLENMRSVQVQITKPRPQSKLPGYVTPAQKGKVALHTHVDPELRDAFKAIAKLNGVTVDALLRDLISATVEQYQQPNKLQADITHSIERYQRILYKVASTLVPSGSK